MKFVIAFTITLLATLASSDILAPSPPQSPQLLILQSPQPQPPQPPQPSHQCGGIGDEMSAAKTKRIVAIWSKYRNLLKNLNGEKENLR